MTIQFLENLLRAYILKQIGSWHQFISLIKFTYTNNFCLSIKMTPYKDLYRRIYRT